MEVAANGKKQTETATSIACSLDDSGALTGDGLRTFQYDESRRLVKVKTPAFVSYLHNAMGHGVFKSEPEFEQSEPREDVLGNEFVDWLRTNFGWLFGTARAKNGMGKAFVHADGPLPSWALLGEYDAGGAAGRTLGEVHDWLVEKLTEAGVPDLVANVPTMPAAYLVGIGLEILRTLQLARQPAPMCSP